MPSNLSLPRRVASIEEGLCRSGGRNPAPATETEPLLWLRAAAERRTAGLYKPRSVYVFCPAGLSVTMVVFRFVWSRSPELARWTIHCWRGSGAMLYLRMESVEIFMELGNCRNCREFPKRIMITMK